MDTKADAVKDLNNREEDDLNQTGIESGAPEPCIDNKPPTLEVKPEDGSAQTPTSHENNMQSDASAAGGTNLEELMIFEVLKMLNKVSEDGTKLKSTAENMHNLFEADMKDFERSLQSFSDELNNVINYAETDPTQLLFLRDALKAIMNKHVEVVRLEATNVRDEFMAHINRLERFRNEDIPEFAQEFMDMINEFLNSISTMIVQMHNILTAEDINISQRIAYIEDLLQARREKNEEFYKFQVNSDAAIFDHMNTIKKLLASRAGRSAWQMI